MFTRYWNKKHFFCKIFYRKFTSYFTKMELFWINSMIGRFPEGFCAEMSYFITFIN